MIGAIAGDIIGSPYEHDATKTTNFPLFSRWSRFTDDTVLTVAVARAILRGEDYRDAILDLVSARLPHLCVLYLREGRQGASAESSGGGGSVERVVGVCNRFRCREPGLPMWQSPGRT